MTDSKGKEITIKEYMSAPAVQTKMQEMLIEPRMIRQFTTSVLALAGSDPKIMACEPRSLFNACLTAAAMDLPINKNLGFAHIIPYENKKAGTVEAQFQMGAKGFRQLAQRTGQYKHIHESDVREGELKKRDRLSGEIIFDWIEDDAEREKKKIIGYVSFFELSNGFRSTLYMSVEQLENHATQYSQSYKSTTKWVKENSPWTTNFPAMAIKTVSKLNLSKNGFLSTELQTALTTDQAVVRDDGADYVDGTDLLDDEKATEDQKAAIINEHKEDGGDPTEDLANRAFNDDLTDEDKAEIEAQERSKK